MKEMNLLIKELIANNIPFEIYPFIILGNQLSRFAFPAKKTALLMQ